MDFFKVIQDQEISQSGSVCRGFRTSVKTMLPTIIKCLEEIHTFAKGTPPRTIYVTGHSLGGGLACLFTSAMVMGTAYGPYGTGKKMPDVLKTWPWRSIQLVTFSAPVVGGQTFHNSFNTALASRRIWLDGDPVTQERRHYPVGNPYRIPKEEGSTIASTESHEPYLIRRNLIRDRRKAGFTIKDVPANTEKDEPGEPWKLFKTCLEMLNHLNTVHGNYRECLTDFADNLAEYLLILLREILTGAKQNEINQIIAKMNNFDLKNKPVNELGDIYREWERAKEIKKSDADLYKFLGFCIILAYLSKVSKQDVASLLFIHNPEMKDIKELLTVEHKA
jgi:Lipase (class 3).